MRERAMLDGTAKRHKGMRRKDSQVAESADETCREAVREGVAV